MNDTTQKQTEAAERLYYVESIKPRHTKDSIRTWFRPEAKGYTDDLEQAGKFTEEEVNKHRDYYDNGTDTKAHLVTDIEAGLKGKVLMAVRN